MIEKDEIVLTYKGYVVNIDNNCFKLSKNKVYKQGNNVGEEYQEVVGYYGFGNYDVLLKRIAHEEVMEDKDIETLKEYHTEYMRILKKIKKEGSQIKSAINQ